MADSQRAPELHAIEARLAEYAATIERQAAQLQAFRELSREIGQPLGVVRVIAKAIPAPVGDLDAARMVDLLDRNVARLAEIAARLERLARASGVYRPND